MINLDTHAINVLKNKQKGTFAEFKNGNLIVGIMVAGNEMEIRGVRRIDVCDCVNGKASYLLEQTDGTVVDLPPTYDLVTFQIYDPSDERT